MADGEPVEFQCPFELAHRMRAAIVRGQRPSRFRTWTREKATHIGLNNHEAARGERNFGRRKLRRHPPRMPRPLLLSIGFQQGH